MCIRSYIALRGTARFRHNWHESQVAEPGIYSPEGWWAASTKSNAIPRTFSR